MIITYTMNSDHFLEHKTISVQQTRCATTTTHGLTIVIAACTHYSQTFLNTNKLRLVFRLRVGVNSAVFHFVRVELQDMLLVYRSNSLG